MRKRSGHATIGLVNEEEKDIRKDESLLKLYISVSKGQTLSVPLLN